MFHLNDRLLEKLIDGSASASEVRRIQRHTESCRACARRLEEWRDNYRELDQHFPDLALESGPAATVTPGGLIVIPAAEESGRKWEMELSTILWIATVLMAVLVGYGASRLRNSNEGMGVATRDLTPTPPPPAPVRPAPDRTPDAGLAAGTTDPDVAAREAPGPLPTASDRAAAPAPAPAPRDPLGSATGAPTTPEEPGPPTPSLSISPRFKLASTSEAVRRLGGRLRLLTGLEPDHLEIGPANAVPGAQSGLDVIRVVYRTADGGRILVDQQLIPADSSGFRPIDDPALETGETAYGTSPSGVSVATWLDEFGYRIAVVVQAPVDSVKKLTQLIR